MNYIFIWALFLFLWRYPNNIYNR